ncbi:MAG TPA: vanadium-dependent haloperoxidase [Gaiellaceae bacterium]|nr:vanadium-dependent haloperoxidase [Gaiellaceae bacterium]
MAAAFAAVNVQAHRGGSTTDVLQWYDLTTQSVAAAALPEQVSQERVWAVAWLAAARATHAEGGPQYDEAAFASALHDTLVSLVPAKAADLDAQLAASLAAIPDGRQKERGVAAGRTEAQRVLAERAGDGLDTASVNRPWTAPAAAPGVYQPTGPSVVRAGLADAKPFLIRSKDQFDPGPPPPLTSARYLDSLAEVHSLGSATSITRTSAQTDVARFWAQSSLTTYVQVLRQVIASSERPLDRQVRLVAGFHAIQIDQQIAIHAAKFRYVFWRPVTAIRTGSVDQDANWTPLIASPRHPEYPSGHAAFGGTAEVVLRALVSPEPQDAVSASSATDGGAVHSWTSWAAITNETIDARVWEGVHFRFSDEVGAQFGRDVAKYDLKRLDELGL